MAELSMSIDGHEDRHAMLDDRDGVHSDTDTFAFRAQVDF
jgi:hypothetical protein